MINYDFQLYYLKWMLDNLSHVRKVKLRLKINGTGKKDPVINESLVDANFVRCDTIIDELDYMMLMPTAFETRQHKLINISLRHVTRFEFGSCCYRDCGSYDGRTDQNKKRARLLAHLLSMPLQLNYLRIQQFQWLLHVIAYTSDELLKNALKNVRYAEFCLTSCHFGSNQSIGIGKFLVLVLSNYMPHLQALRLWRPGDFPWTTKIQRESVSILISFWTALTSNEIQGILKILMLITVLFMPCTLLTGINSTNFQIQPQYNYEYGYYIILSILALILIGMITWYKTKQWI
ncbi:unnamed protein product [Rotaria sp. Silwood1]|nr:unnamed protein product [Rotaria sp. Silwood1]